MKKEAIQNTTSEKIQVVEYKQWKKIDQETQKEYALTLQLLEDR